MADLSGKRIRGYEVRDKIGEGGYGAVYRAMQPTVNREVAVKVILPQYASDPDFARRFAREAHLVAQLEHPHIVPLHDYWRDDTGAYLVMRYLRGGSLRHLLGDGQPLALDQVARILSQMARALDFAHRADIIHRDLKPDNILLDEQGNAYLSDFGMAKPTSGDSSVTQTDGIAGTPAYIAPEQIEGQDIGPQADVYTLGVVLYELLTGRHPFVGASPLEMIVKHMKEPLPSLGVLRPDLPESLDVVVQRATAKDPDDRYLNALALLDEFNDIANPLPVGDPLRATVTAGAVLLEAETRSLPDVPVPQTAHSYEATTRESPRTPDQRNRRRMLSNVRAFWIDGLLENSLHGAAMIDLGMAEHTGQVENPWDMLLRRPGTADQSQTANTPVIDLFDRLNGALLILGEPGSGKTTTLLDLARDLLHRAERDLNQPIPVVLNLSSWSESRKPLAEWLVDELRNKYQAPRKVAEAWVNDDTLLLLLDGLDEVAAEYREDCVVAINDYRDRHGFVDIVVCSRTHDYESLTGRLRLNGAVVIQPLNDTQIGAYLDTFGPSMATLRDLLRADADLREMARSPLMLSVMTMAYRGVSAGDVPQFVDDIARRQHLFDVYVQRMFERRIDQGAYPEAMTRQYLRWLAERMQEHAQSVFQIEGIQPAWLTPGQRRRYHRWLLAIHVVLQAFAWGFARFVTAPFDIPGSGVVNGLMWTIPGAYWGWLIASDNYRKLIFQIPGGMMFGAAVAGDAFLNAGTDVALQEFIGGLIIYQSMILGGSYIMRRSGYERDRVVSQDAVRFSRNAIKPWLVGTSLLAGFLTVFINLDVAETEPTNGQLFLALAMAGTMGAITGAIMGGLASTDVGSSSRPNAGMRRMAGTALRLGGLVLVLFYAIVFLSTVPIGGLTFSLVHSIVSVVAFGVNGAILYGGYTVIQHLALRRVLYADGVTPTNYAHFLDHAVGLILLRRVGGSYVFIHRTLLEYFAGGTVTTAGRQIEGETGSG